MIKRRLAVFAVLISALSTVPDIPFADTFTVDLTKEAPSDGNQYFLIITARPPGNGSMFGHAFVVFGIEDHSDQKSVIDSYGLNMVVPTKWNKFRSAVWIFGLPAGAVTSEALSDSNPISGVANMQDSIIVKLDKTRFEDGDNYVKEFSASNLAKVTAPPLQIQAIFNDCVNFVHAVAMYSGLRLLPRSIITPSEFYPTDYIKSVIQDFRTIKTVRVEDPEDNSLPFVTYSGLTVNDTPHGPGQLTYNDGAVLRANFRFGVAEGDGKWTKNGNTVTGTWLHGKFDTTKATVTWRDGSQFKGSVAPRTFDMVNGTLNESGGIVLTGAFSGQKITRGTATYPKLGSFDGDFQNGTPFHGTGNYASGTVYTGYYDSNGYFSNGVANYKNGDSYSGTFQNGTYLKGKYTFPDGSAYAGTWKPDGTPDTGVFHEAGQPYGQTIRNGQIDGHGAGTSVSLPVGGTGDDGLTGTITNGH
ncbi:MAG: hypothetical protein OSB38_16605 [Paraburkholderia fungorum]|nr:hypothetical protein [Paraburkholderia fungorum]